MIDSNTTNKFEKKPFRRCVIFLFLLSLVVFWSCDRQGSSPSSIDGLAGTTPPPIANEDGPLLTSQAPFPGMDAVGPEQQGQAKELSAGKGSLLDSKGLPEAFYLSSTTSTPGKATLSSPSGSVNSAAPQFQWQPVSGATWYYVWVRDSGTMNTSGSPRIAHWITASDAGCGGGSGTCSWYADKNLEIGNAKWWIQTWNPAGFGPWSDAMDFSVSSSINLPAAVTLNSPNSQVSTTKPTFSWNAVSGANWYYVWVRDSGTMNFNRAPRIKKWVSASQASCSGGSTCSWTADKDLIDGNATWWVQSWNTNGFGGWSSGMNFLVSDVSLPEAAKLVSPNSSINNVRPEFEWEAVPEATWYYVWVRDSETMDFSGDPRIKKWVTPQQAGCGSGTCSWIADKDLADGEAIWWINTWNEAVGSGNLGTWSSGMEFVIEPLLDIEPPEILTLMVPGGEFDRLLIEWQYNGPPDEAEYVNIEFKKSSATNWTKHSNNLDTSGHIHFVGLESLTKYDFRVRACNSNDKCSDWSEKKTQSTWGDLPPVTSVDVEVKSSTLTTGNIIYDLQINWEYDPLHPDNYIIVIERSDDDQNWEPISWEEKEEAKEDFLKEYNYRLGISPSLTLAPKGFYRVWILAEIFNAGTTENKGRFYSNSVPFRIDTPDELEFINAFSSESEQMVLVWEYDSDIPATHVEARSRVMNTTNWNIILDIGDPYSTGQILNGVPPNTYDVQIRACYYTVCSDWPPGGRTVTVQP